MRAACFVFLLLCTVGSGHLYKSSETTTSGESNGTSTHHACPKKETVFQAHHDRARTGLCLLVVIGVIFILELILRKSESKLKDFHTSFDLIQCLYRELMILGLVSMIVLIVRESAGDALSSKWILAVEFTHIFVFFIAIVFVFQVATVFVFTQQHQRTWQRITSLPSSIFVASHSQNAVKPHNIILNKIFFLDPLLFQLAVRAANTRFLRTHNLPPDFSFSKYLRLHISEMIIECVDPTIPVYIGLLVNLFIWAAAFSKYGINGIFVCFWIVLLFVFISYWVCIRACGLLFRDAPNSKELSQLVLLHDHTKNRNASNTIEVDSKKAELERHRKSSKQANLHNNPNEPSLLPQPVKSQMIPFPLSDTDKKAEYRTVRAILSVTRFLTALMMALNAYFFGLLVTVHHDWDLGRSIPTLIVVLVCIFVVIPHSIALCAFLHGVLNPDDESILKVLEYIEELNDLRGEILNKLTNANDLTLYMCRPQDLQNLLRSFDKNNDGTVTIQEFISGLRVRGVNMCSRKVDRLVRIMDWDGSGSIELVELKDMISIEANRRLEEKLRLAFDEVSGHSHTTLLAPDGLGSLLAKVEREYCDPEQVLEEMRGSLTEKGEIPLIAFKKWYLDSCPKHMTRLDSVVRRQRLEEDRFKEEEEERARAEAEEAEVE